MHRLKLLPVLMAVLLAMGNTEMLRADCGNTGTWLQVLGSGGPEADDGRASSGYLVWQAGRARLLVDLGAGSLQNFEKAGADINDLDVILLTHLHVDHSNDLPGLIKASYFTGRGRDLPVYGPTGNHLMPSMTGFVRALFGEQGAFRYLGSYLDGTDDYRLVAHDIDARDKTVRTVIRVNGLRVSSVAVHHGPIPALAWRVEIAGKSIVFSGDMNNSYNTLAGLAKDADLLVAHHAIPEDAGSGARNLHMPPSAIGKIAREAGIKQLVLSHRMNRSLGREPASTAIIRQRYSGPLQFAEDLQCIAVR